MITTFQTFPKLIFCIVLTSELANEGAVGNPVVNYGILWMNHYSFLWSKF